MVFGRFIATSFPYSILIFSILVRESPSLAGALEIAPIPANVLQTTEAIVCRSDDRTGWAHHVTMIPLSGAGEPHLPGQSTGLSFLPLDDIRNISIIRNMSNEDLTPLLTLSLTTEKQIRAYVHPTRMTILASLASEKQTVSGIARQLGVHPANLTHHFKLLEKVGLIKLVEKRDTGKNLEKYYRAVSYNFTVSLGGESQVNKQALALSILRDNLSAGLKALNIQGGDQTVMAFLKTARLRPEEIVEFEKKLLILLNEFNALDSTTGTAYNLNIGLYPGEVENRSVQEIHIREEE